MQHRSGCSVTLSPMSFLLNQLASSPPANPEMHRYLVLEDCAPVLAEPSQASLSFQLWSDLQSPDTYHYILGLQLLVSEDTSQPNFP